MSVEDFENEGRLKRRIIGGVVVFALIGLVAAFVLKKPSAPAPKKAKATEMVIVSVPPPPPPPLPPPPPEPEKPQEPEEKEEMIEQDPVVANEPEEPGPEEPPEDLGTGVVGEGSNSFGLGTRGNGSGGGGAGTGKRGGGRFDRYAVLLQNTLAAELRRNPKTRSAAFNVQVSLRIDAEGRITSIKPKSSTGDASLDATLRNDFIGIRFTEAPPADMPMPVHTRLVGRKR